MVKVKRVKEAPGETKGPMPDGNYKFLVLEASLLVETINMPGYTGEKRFEHYEVIEEELGPEPDIESYRQIVEVYLRCEGPAVIQKYRDGLWQTPKGVYKYRQFLEAIGLDKDGEYDPQEFVEKGGVAYMKGKPNRDGNIFLEATRYYPANDAPKVEVVSVPEDDVPF